MKTYTDGFFSVNSSNGFLPLHDPLQTLPTKFSELQFILDNMPICKKDGSKGYLALNGAIEKATNQLPNFYEEVKKEKDPFVKAAIFRAYSFLTSAYTLSPSYQFFKKTGDYGLGNKIIPKNIAQPFVKISEMLEVSPWLDYHYAYSLGNYIKKDTSKGLEWTNLSMAVKFSGLKDEEGFIMLHVDINQYSADLVKASLDLSENKSDPNPSLLLLGETLKKMNERRKLMWEASSWKNYNDFRIFIMGSKGNTEIFPDGNIYEGVWETPKSFRGQTGAQDNIIPTADIISGVINYYPKNQLTDYLLDLRNYRPKCIQAFFSDISEKMSHSPLLDRLVRNENFRGMLLLMKVYEEIYLFRNGHWQFVQKYIMQNTSYPVATGGTPITSWIPNQIKAVLSAMNILFNKMEKYTDENWNKIEWMESYNNKVTLLNNQLKILSIKAFNPEEVFILNEKLGFNDY